MKEKVINKIKTAEYIPEDNRWYGAFMKLKEAVLNGNEEHSPHLNTENITGIWYLTGFVTDNDVPAVMIRSKIKRGTKDRLFLVSEIFDYVCNDLIYDYDADILAEENEFFINTQAVIARGILENDVYAVYDSERKL